MFSKAKGTVGIDPKYVAAKNGKDSYIYFRLGCELTINSKKITEWYTIKAFGMIADYLSTTIQKGSRLYLEAVIRNTRYQKNGIEYSGVEFHAFKVRDLSTDIIVDSRTGQSIVHSETSDHAVSKDAISTPANVHSEQHTRMVQEMAWQTISEKDIKAFSSKFRQVYEEQKARVFGITSPQPTILDKSEAMPNNCSQPTLVTTKPTREELYLDGVSKATIPLLPSFSDSVNSINDNLLKARKALQEATKLRGSSAINSMPNSIKENHQVLRSLQH